MRLGRFALRRVALVLLALVPLTGCGLTHLQDLSFRVDNRLHFVSPKARVKAHQPLTVTWTIRDFRIAAQGSEPASRSAGYFAIFVDRQPIKPGDSMKAVAEDRFCKHNPTCPDKAYLDAREIYLTTQTSYTFDQIVNISGDQDKVQMHTITIVLMDTSGHRIGEAAWELDVRLPKVGIG